MSKIKFDKQNTPKLSNNQQLGTVQICPLTGVRYNNNRVIIYAEIIIYSRRGQSAARGPIAALQLIFAALGPLIILKNVA